MAYSDFDSDKQQKEFDCSSDQDSALGPRELIEIPAPQNYFADISSET